MVRTLIAAGVAPLIMMGAGPAAAASWPLTPFEECQGVLKSGGPVSPNLVISNETKEPGFWTTLKRGDTVLVRARLDSRIDTSPGQWFFGNGAWTAAGNGRPAPGDWLIPGASEFAVAVKGMGREAVIAGAEGACASYQYDGGLAFPRVGLNVVQHGFATPLRNRWEGSIGVRLTIFR
ncbi:MULTISPECIES: hypothetical protein [Catenuloplanes]|uniref:Uncharacterized protein n=1 Tax=Catenuloplanes niger TaxID=587534 RepID=A0AAE3ZL72_9ACTN|nr:hypothetical protein [Catenuloplanes niger]MDR7320721.1 hypothetical protein [Catenuloplanes niger]